jgi:hypothetical protein
MSTHSGTFSGPDQAKHRVFSIRNSGSSGLWKSWSLAWLGGVGLGLVNATTREFVYREALGEETAQRVSTFVLLAMIGAYVVFLERRWPIPFRGQALVIGAAWAAATVTFEFLFGHYVDPSHFTWTELAANYNLLEGKLWVLVPISMVFLPAAARRINRGGRKTG